jgi:DNA polymerase III epsilon subunit-like protein
MGGGTAGSELARRLIDPRWYSRMALFIGGFPDNYLVFDCETNGLEPRSKLTLPVELGWCMVKDRVAVHEGSFLLNWALHPDTDAAWFEESVHRTERGMREKGIERTISWDRIHSEGNDPREVVPQFRDFLVEAQTNNYKFVGHNIYGFDRPIVENATFTATGDMFRFDYRLFLDTGMIEKSHSAGIPVPGPGERPVFRWYEDVRGIVRKGKWNLGGCAHKYGLVEKHSLDLTSAHAAGFDCHMNHLLLEAYRELADSYQPDG